MEKWPIFFCDVLQLIDSTIIQEQYIYNTRQFCKCDNVHQFRIKFKELRNQTLEPCETEIQKFREMITIA